MPRRLARSWSKDTQEGRGSETIADERAHCHFDFLSLFFSIHVYVSVFVALLFAPLFFLVFLILPPLEDRAYVPR